MNKKALCALSLLAMLLAAGCSGEVAGGNVTTPPTEEAIRVKDITLGSLGEGVTRVDDKLSKIEVMANSMQYDIHELAFQSDTGAPVETIIYDSERNELPKAQVNLKRGFNTFYIKASAMDYTEEWTIVVNCVVPDEITWELIDAQTVYYMGEEFKPFKMKYIKNGEESMVDVTLDMLEGFDTLTNHSCFAYILYDNQRIEFGYNVKQCFDDENKLEAKDIKYTYRLNEELVYPKFSLVFHNLTEEIKEDELSYTGFDNKTPGEQTVTIKIRNTEYKYNVVVFSDDEGIELSSIKSLYYVNDPFIGGSLRVIKHGKSTFVPITASMVKGLDMSKAGKQDITITYNDVVINHTIYVIEHQNDLVLPKGEALNISSGKHLLAVLRVVAKIDNTTTSEALDALIMDEHSKITNDEVNAFILRCNSLGLNNEQLDALNKNLPEALLNLNNEANLKALAKDDFNKAIKSINSLINLFTPAQLAALFTEGKIENPDINADIYSYELDKLVSEGISSILNKIGSEELNNVIGAVTGGHLSADVRLAMREALVIISDYFTTNSSVLYNMMHYDELSRLEKVATYYDLADIYSYLFSTSGNYNALMTLAEGLINSNFNKEIKRFAYNLKLNLEFVYNHSDLVNNVLTAIGYEDLDYLDIIKDSINSIDYEMPDISAFEEKLRKLIKTEEEGFGLANLVKDLNPSLALVIKNSYRENALHEATIESINGELGDVKQVGDIPVIAKDESPYTAFNASYRLVQDGKEADISFYSIKGVGLNTYNVVFKDGRVVNLPYYVYDENSDISVINDNETLYSTLDLVIYNEGGSYRYKTIDSLENDLQSGLEYELRKKSFKVYFNDINLVKEYKLNDLKYTYEIVNKPFNGMDLTTIKVSTIFGDVYYAVHYVDAKASRITREIINGDRSNLVPAGISNIDIKLDYNCYYKLERKSLYFDSLNTLGAHEIPYDVSGENRVLKVEVVKLSEARAIKEIESSYYKGVNLKNPLPALFNLNGVHLSYGRYIDVLGNTRCFDLDELKLIYADKYNVAKEEITFSADGVDNNDGTGSFNLYVEVGFIKKDTFPFKGKLLSDHEANMPKITLMMGNGSFSAVGASNKMAISIDDVEKHKSLTEAQYLDYLNELLQYQEFIVEGYSYSSVTRKNMFYFLESEHIKYTIERQINELSVVYSFIMDGEEFFRVTVASRDENLKNLEFDYFYLPKYEEFDDVYPEVFGKYDIAKLVQNLNLYILAEGANGHFIINSNDLAAYITNDFFKAKVDRTEAGVKIEISYNELKVSGEVLLKKINA